MDIDTDSLQINHPGGPDRHVDIENPLFMEQSKLKKPFSIELQDVDEQLGKAGSYADVPQNMSVNNITDADLTAAAEVQKDVGRMMWTWEHVGLYAHYAGVGFNGGISGLCLNFCVYYFQGAENLCPNANSIIFIPWSFKIVYAMFTDSFRPFGMRRKPYMVAGWIGLLLFTFLLAVTAPVIGSQGWILLSVGTMFFLMLADVPADGYSVEMGRFESETTRGQILAMGQRIRFICTMLAGFIQAFLVNGPTTNPEGCPISASECWAWGLTVADYYGLLFCILFVLFIPIIFLKEMDGSQIPQRTFNEHRLELWDTLQNRTTLYLLIFVSGSNCFGSLINQASVYLQYYVITLTNFQSGIDSVTSFLALAGAVWLFQRYLINRDWRLTKYASSIFTALLGFQWLLAFYNAGGLRNPWFTVFINTNQTFSAGITQVLSAMAVIELAKPGQESVTYEFIVSVNNAAAVINTVIAVQLLGAVGATACTNPGLDDDTYPRCGANEVDVNGVSNYLATDGPTKFANYTYLILAINIAATLIFTRFLPSQKAECHEWRKQGEESGTSRYIGYASIFIAVTVIGYGIFASIFLLIPATACSPAFGGDGC